MRCTITFGDLLCETEADGEYRPDLLDDLAARCIRLAEAMLAHEPVAARTRTHTDDNGDDD